MPKLLTPEPTWVSEVQVPANGDLADESSLRTPFQQVANCARWLFDFIILHGVFAIRSVPDFAALKAIAAPSSGQVAYVHGRGIYLFLGGAARADDPPWILAPSAGGAGSWVHPLANMLTGPRSFVTTDASNKLDSSLLKNGLVAVLKANPVGGAPPVTSANSVDVPNFAITPADVHVGDLFYVDWFGQIMCRQANSWGSFFPVIRDSGQDYQLNGMECRITQNNNFQNSRFHVGTVWTASTTSVVFKARVASGGGETNLENGEMRCLHFRP